MSTRPFTLVSTVRRLALVAMVLVMVMAAIRTAERPAGAAGSLVGERLQTATFQATGTCFVSGPSNFTFTASGDATGPFGGPFAETGSFTIVNGMGVTSFSANFDIGFSGTTSFVIGQKTLVPMSPSGSCDPANNSVFIPATGGSPLTLHYTATISQSGSTSTDSGTAFLTIFAPLGRGTMTQDFMLQDPTATPTDTPTDTPVPPTNTPTDTPTNTPIISTNTPTDTPTNTPVVPTNTPTDTPTNTPVLPTNTPTDTPTNTPVPSTKTPVPTSTPVPWTIVGLYQPVDNPPVINTVKAGSTIPLKFEVFSGGTELTSTSVVSGISAVSMACQSGSAGIDAIEVVSSGGTSLRYDTTSGQFIYNWKTAKTMAGTCVRVTVTFTNGSVLSALFQFT